uniref:Uncharacterized protein n=1 Tax=Arundo donax TaxID=35708 RepID=A0A0A9F852_ARUDO
MAHIPTSPPAAAGHRVSPTPRPSPSFPPRKTAPSSVGTAGLPSWSWRAATAAARAAASSNRAGKCSLRCVLGSSCLVHFQRLALIHHASCSLCAGVASGQWR